MDLEKLLEEAKLRYPIGTKISCAYDGEVSVVENEPFVDDNDNISVRNNQGLGVPQMLYYRAEKKWATILEPSNQATSNKVEELIQNCEKFKYKINEDNPDNNLVGFNSAIDLCIDEIRKTFKEE